jgi:hypothetical protein
MQDKLGIRGRRVMSIKTVNAKHKIISENEKINAA